MHAERGIYTFNGGNVLDVQDSKFINNKGDIITGAFIGTNTPDISVISNTEFILNDDYYNNLPGQQTANEPNGISWQRLALPYPYGITIDGCRFINARTTNGPNVDHGVAIDVFGGYYNMLANNSNQQSIISGFTTGILNQGADFGTLPITTIRNTKFDKNMIGISNATFTDIEMEFNTFNTGYFHDGYGGMNFGLNSWSTRKFIFNNNIVTGLYNDWVNPGANTSDAHGILINDIRDNQIPIRKNIFSKLDVGAFSLGSNAANDGSIGLLFLCNTFTINRRDVWNTNEMQINQEPNNLNINTFGMVLYGCNNTFSSNDAYGNISENWINDWPSNGGKWLDYYFDNLPNSLLKYKPSVNTNLNLIGALSDESCTFPLVGLKDTNGIINRIAILNAIDDSTTALNGLRLYYNSLRDGGNSQALNSYIDNASQAIALKNELMSKAP
jgi:hypothetical protein